MVLMERPAWLFPFVANPLAIDAIILPASSVCCLFLRALPNRSLSWLSLRPTLTHKTLSFTQHNTHMKLSKTHSPIQTNLYI